MSRPGSQVRSHGLEEKDVFEVTLSVAVAVESPGVETNRVCRLGSSVSILIKVPLSVYRVINRVTVVGVKKPRFSAKSCMQAVKGAPITATVHTLQISGQVVSL